ncbi:hypothetical protein [Microbacterium sp.]|jgi:hypothetical protein|uniref:hypothetical protein n=1 Tax=Microbacterium sp. TaxID=51671 RepID=UPI0037CBDC90
MTQHIVTAAVVKVSIGSPSGNSVAQFVRRDDLVPAGVDEEQLERLVRQGFIAEYEGPEPDPEPTAFSKDDVDAAVKAATEAQSSELAQAKADAEAAKADAEKARAELAKAQQAAKAPAKQS